MTGTLGRILIVDDDRDVLEMLRLYLSDGRFEVMTAHGCAEAVKIARQHRPDAVLLDVLKAVGGMDGLEALRALLGVDATIAVVLVTAYVSETIGREGLTIGAFGYIPKPFDFGVLDRLMRAAVAAGARSGRSPGRCIAS
jgi:DNA-binding response OmpR family regulator